MSPTPPNDPKPPVASNTLSNAFIWAFLALAFAGGLLYYGTTIQGDKKNFYFVIAGISAAVGLYNGYTAWTMFQKSKQPPSK